MPFAARVCVLNVCPRVEPTLRVLFVRSAVCVPW